MVTEAPARQARRLIAVSPVPEPSRDPRRKVIHRHHEQDAQPQQPAVRLEQQRQRRHARHGFVDQVQAVLQIALREHEQARADHRAVHGAHAADHQHQQDVQHDLERQRGVRPAVAQPERVERAGQCGEGGRQQVGQAAVQHRAVADGLGAERISRMACSTRPNGELTMRSSSRNSTTATAAIR